MKKSFIQSFLIRISSAIAVVFLILGSVFMIASYIASEPNSVAGIAIMLSAVILSIVALVATNLAIFNLSSKMKESAFIAEKIAQGETFFNLEDRDSSEIKSALKSIATNFSERMKQIERLASGDFDFEIGLYSDADVFGQALQEMKFRLRNLIQTNEEKENLRKSIQNLLAKTSQIISGDYTVKVAVFSSDIEPVAKAFNSMAKAMNELMVQMKQITEKAHTLAKRLDDAVERLERENNVQIEQISQSSMKLVQMSPQIQKISDTLSTALQVSENLTLTSQYGAKTASQEVQVMTALRRLTQETTKKTKKLGERSQEMQQFVQLILTLKDKIGLLALNLKITQARNPNDKFQSLIQEIEQTTESFDQFASQAQSLVQMIQSDVQELITSAEQIIHEVIACSTLASRSEKALTELEKTATELNEKLNELLLLSNQNVPLSEDVVRLSETIARSSRAMQANIKQLAEFVNESMNASSELANILARIRTSENVVVAKK